LPQVAERPYGRSIVGRNPPGTLSIIRVDGLIAPPESAELVVHGFRPGKCGINRVAASESLVHGNLQRIVTGAHAVAQIGEGIVLAEFLKIRPATLQIARSRKSCVNIRSPIEIPSSISDVSHCEPDIGRESLFNRKVPGVHILSLPIEWT